MRPNPVPTTRRLARFRRDESGGITPFSMLMLFVFMMIAGLALDMTHHVKAQTQLQIAADTAAHAAIVSRRGNDAAAARAVALDVLQGNMPSGRFGQVVTAEHIEFGRWEDGEFRPDPDETSAVRVLGLRNADRRNALRTYLLRTVGVDAIDVAALAVFETYQPICIEEGFVAEGKVDVQSNNTYLRGFCIHSNSFVRINQNNFFEEGTIVSMPDLDLLQMPNSGFDRNEGLEAALRQGSLDIRVLRELDQVIDGILNDSPEYRRAYVENPTPIIRNLSGQNNRLDASDFEEGRIHDFRCSSGGQKISIPQGTSLRRIVLVTNCVLDLGNNVSMEDVLIASTSTATRAIDGGQGIRIGREDNCESGGGAQIITKGGMRFPGNMGIFGSQLIASGDINFAARADGVQGASMIAGGEIDGTSNSSMARCNRGMDDNIRAPYFRMVR